MRRSVVVIGGGGHARVVIDVIRSRPEQWEFLGFVDPQACEHTQTLLGTPRLGDDAALRERAGQVAGIWGVLGVGGLAPSELRRRIVASYEGSGIQWASPVHARATVSTSADVAPGAVVMAGAVVNAGARIGEHAVINTGAVVEHDGRVSAFALVGPGAVVGGGAAIEEDAFVGMGARVRDHVTVGRGAVVGMGAVVVKDVPPGAKVVGVPAREAR